MFDPNVADPIETLSRSHDMLTSLRKFDELEIDPVCRGQLALSKEEECRIVTYLRVQRNVDSMTALNHVAHFQALSMLARAILELSLDIRLMQLIPDASLRDAYLGPEDHAKPEPTSLWMDHIHHKRIADLPDPALLHQDPQIVRVPRRHRISAEIIDQPVNALIAPHRRGSG